MYTEQLILEFTAKTVNPSVIVFVVVFMTILLRDSGQGRPAWRFLICGWVINLIYIYTETLPDGTGAGVSLNAKIAGMTSIGTSSFFFAYYLFCRRLPPRELSRTALAR